MTRVSLSRIILHLEVREWYSYQRTHTEKKITVSEIRNHFNTHTQLPKVK